MKNLLEKIMNNLALIRGADATMFDWLSENVPPGADPDDLMECAWQAVREGATEIADSIAIWMIHQSSSMTKSRGRQLLVALAAKEIPESMFNLAVEQLKGNKKSAEKEAFNLVLRVLGTTDIEQRLRSEALFLMGTLFLTGRGTRKDIERAKEYYEQATEQGHSIAPYNLALYFHGRMAGWKGESDFNRAAHFYRVAMERGNLKAQTNLAVLHYSGSIHDADEEYGLELLRKSTAEGDDSAKCAMEDLTSAKQQARGWGQDFIDVRMAAQRKHTLGVIHPEPVRKVWPIEGTRLGAEMPAVTRLLGDAYLRWLERKDWGIGEMIGGRSVLPHVAFPTATQFLSHCLAQWNAESAPKISLSDTFGCLLDSGRKVDGIEFRQYAMATLCDAQWEYLLYASTKALEWGSDPESASQASREEQQRGYQEWCKSVKNETGYSSPRDLVQALHKDKALQRRFKEWVREAFINLVSPLSLQWFYERRYDPDGYRECVPGIPSLDYFADGIGTKLDEDDRYVTIWESTSNNGVLYTPPMPLTSVVTETVDKTTHRVEAKVVGEIFGSRAVRQIAKHGPDDVLGAAYASSQHELLFFVCADSSGFNLEKDYDGKPFLLVRAWERHRDSSPGVGAQCLLALIAKAKREWPTLSSILFKIEPLQFSPPLGGEPEEIRVLMREASLKLISYVANLGIKERSDIKIHFAEQTLNADLKELLASKDVTIRQKDLIRRGMAVVGGIPQGDFSSGAKEDLYEEDALASSIKPGTFPPGALLPMHHPDNVRLIDVLYADEPKVDLDADIKVLLKNESDRMERFPGGMSAFMADRATKNYFLNELSRARAAGDIPDAYFDEILEHLGTPRGRALMLERLVSEAKGY